MSTSFTHIPILSFRQSLSPETKPDFLAQLRHALLEVGFLYLSDTGIDEKLVEEVARQGKGFFEAPEEEKRKLEMKNCKCSWR